MNGVIPQIVVVLQTLVQDDKIFGEEIHPVGGIFFAK